MGKDVIIALDFPDREETLAFLDRFTGKKPFVKIGMELFYAEGPQIVREIKRRGHKIFLDLKLCDIPNTVKGGMRSLSHLDVDMTNLHAFGTIAMMEAAIEGLTRPDGTTASYVRIPALEADQAYSWAQPIPEGTFDNYDISLVAPLDESAPVPSCRNADGPYHPGQYVLTVDGFLVTPNVTAAQATVLDTGFAYSDHNPVAMTFTLS